MKIIPAIDLIDGSAVRLIQGNYGRKLSYEITPVDAALKWENAGAKLLHVVDLDGAKEGRPVNLKVIEEITHAVKVPVEAGGGFRNEDDIQKALDKGVFRVVVGSKALEDINFAKTCVKKFGDKIIFSIDVKGFSPSVRGWEKEAEIDLPTLLKWFVDFGVKEIIYTDIASDGMLQGPNIKNLEYVLKTTGINIISAGGVKTIAHIHELKKLEARGLSGVIIGRALYEGTIDLREAVNAGEADNTVS